MEEKPEVVVRDGEETPAALRLVVRRAWVDKRMLVAASLVGIFYGLLVRLAFGLELAGDWLAVVSVGFIFGVPLALGFVVVALAERRFALPWGAWIVLPWPAAMLSLLAALLLAWEGIICIALWLPLFVMLSALGGVLAGVWRRWQRRRVGAAGIAGVMLVPFLIAPVERVVPATDRVRTVETTIEVAAPADVVWREIVEVRAIREEEHGASWVHAIGFPRPVAARSLGEGVGSVRHATFERGVLFVETVTAWEPRRVLEFAIDAEAVPNAALDPHVTVGGPYFDVLHGSYRIEPLGEGRVRLHLASRHRLSTRFNAYSGAWTDAIMAETQRYILAIVARRAEAAARRG